MGMGYGVRGDRASRSSWSTVAFSSTSPARWTTAGHHRRRTSPGSPPPVAHRPARRSSAAGTTTPADAMPGPFTAARQVLDLPNRPPAPPQPPVARGRRSAAAPAGQAGTHLLRTDERPVASPEEPDSPLRLERQTVKCSGGALQVREILTCAPTEDRRRSTGTAAQGSSDARPGGRGGHTSRDALKGHSGVSPESTPRAAVSAVRPRCDGASAHHRSVTRHHACPSSPSWRPASGVGRD